MTRDARKAANLRRMLDAARKRIEALKSDVARLRAAALQAGVDREELECLRRIHAARGSA